MIHIPRKGAPRSENNAGGVGLSPYGTTVTTGASSGVKGTPATLLANTSFDTYRIKIVTMNYSGGNGVASQCCMDLLIGAATESILIPDLLAGSSQNPGLEKVWDFPLYIPAGSRLSAQAAGDRVSTAFQVAIYLYGGDGIPTGRVGTKVVTYGVSAVPAGTTFVPGSTGVEGAWTQVVLATSENHFAVVPSYQISGVAFQTARLALDVGIGAATEVEIADGYQFVSSSAEVVGGPINSEPCYCDIPSSTRLVVRGSMTTAVGAGNHNAALHCVS
jgi:hypothetical protein